MSIRSKPFLVCSLLALAVLAGIPHALAAEPAPGTPTNLRCEYLKNPAGIDVARPRFSWIIENPERGEAQSAYQLLVASMESVDGRQVSAGLPRRAGLRDVRIVFLSIVGAGHAPPGTHYNNEAGTRRPMLELSPGDR